MAPGAAAAGGSAGRKLAPGTVLATAALAAARAVDVGATAEGALEAATGAGADDALSFDLQAVSATDESERTKATANGSGTARDMGA